VRWPSGDVSFEGASFKAAESPTPLASDLHSSRSNKTGGGKNTTLVSPSSNLSHHPAAKWAPAMAPRRLTAVDVQFTIEMSPFVSTNLPAASGPSLTNVFVRAGVSYYKLRITAVSGLGMKRSQVKMKIVTYDFAATLQSCPTVVSAMPAMAPFNDATGQLDESTEDDDALNDFTANGIGFQFLQAGEWRICYYNGATWEELEPKITVLGAEKTDNKFWCMASPDVGANPYGINACGDQAFLDANPGYPPCECSGKIEGIREDPSNAGAITAIGSPNPTSPPWLLTLTEYSLFDCGQQMKDSFERLTAAVTNYQGYTIHNFGPRRNALFNVWRLCYCVGYDNDNADGYCAANGTIAGTKPEGVGDFAQDVGKLVTIGVDSMIGQISIRVYPTLRFQLKILCGIQSAGQANAEGGCNPTNEVRYKIVEHKTENDWPYYDSRSGCRFLPQVETTIDNAKVLGGHIGPDNCESAVNCQDTPEELGPKFPTWNDVQMDASYENSIMVQKVYDVCYCDGNCLNSASWFKAGQIMVLPILAYFTQADAIGTQSEPIVNTPYYVIVHGNRDSSWAEIDVATGTPTDAAEMKILKDDDATVDKVACLNKDQPDVVSGHRLENGNTDYTSPETLYNGASRPIGQLYGKVFTIAGDPGSKIPNINILEAGWFAICYCDSNCNEEPNWSVYGRQLVSGPKSGQTWKRYVGVTFDLKLEGWNLGLENRVMILSDREELGDCGNGAATPRIFGPDSVGTVLQRRDNEANVLHMAADPRGTEITFAKRHYLQDGDQIWLTGVNPPANDQNWADMFNGVHEVFVACDTPGPPECYKILIPVVFPAADFPLNQQSHWENIDWRRASEETFSKIRAKEPSKEGRGYVVCWSPKGDTDANFVGQAGLITVKSPIAMPACNVGLTTVKPQVAAGGAPVLISFTTGDISRYALANGPMELKVSFNHDSFWDANCNNGAGCYVPGLEPRNYQLGDLRENEDWNERSEATQAVCGQIFLELWSQDTEGFPQPLGCYYKEDTVNPDVTLREMIIVFSPMNHLKKQTKYMIVMNADIAKTGNGPLAYTITEDYPSQGAIFVWSMDDINEDPYRVIELGSGGAMPDFRVPPRNTEQPPELVLLEGEDGRFAVDTGFKIFLDEAGDTNLGNSVLELYSYCRAFRSEYPDSTPPISYQCQVCYREEDCGNGNVAAGIEPNPTLNWCYNVLEANCPQAAGSNTAVPTFNFQLAAEYGTQIKASAIVRIFMTPLTQWHLGSSCQAANVDCMARNNVGDCAQPICEVEAVGGGVSVGVSEYPVNIVKLVLPFNMEPLATSVKLTVAVGGLPVPKGGFLPQTIGAEIMKDDATAPDYWPTNSLATGGAKLYARPVIISASLVTHLGDGNNMPFVNDDDNIIYIRMVLGATLWAKIGDGVKFQFALPNPQNKGYQCSNNMKPEGVTVPNPLGVIGDQRPTYQGRMGPDGNLYYSQEESYWQREVTPTVACSLLFRENNVYYARSTVYMAIMVDNPVEAMKVQDPINQWYLNVALTDGNYNVGLPSFPFAAQKLIYPVVSVDDLQGITFFDENTFVPRSMYLTGMPGYGSAVPTLGKLTNMIVNPSSFGLGTTNMMDIFFRTEQEVGTIRDTIAEIWVIAPTGFDFGLYCGAYQLEETYYIPEPASVTNRLPVGEIIECKGSPATASDVTFNRAKVMTTGRLLRNATYGFRLVVTNSMAYVRSQLQEWKMYTYLHSIQAGVDGSFVTSRFNEREVGSFIEYPSDYPATLPPNSYGCYLHTMKPGSLGVQIADLRPTVAGMAPTDITFLPIIVQVSMQKAVRILAPAGYAWDFLETEFRYKAPNLGVPEDQVVIGAEQDLPITGVPARPVSEPLNRLTIDYMQAPWIPGVKYGFTAKIRVPALSPTSAGNFFSIEFGYLGDVETERLEAGVVQAPLVRRIINGRVGFTTSIVGMDSDIQFDMQVITMIPRAGGLVITGPPSFTFDEHCQPKPLTGFPEFPYDSTCAYSQNSATGAVNIEIIAGPSGIPPAMYRFYLVGKNPPQAVPLAIAGAWTFNSYGVISEMDMLDYPTTVPGFSVNNPMLGAEIIAPPKPDEDCWFYTWERMQEEQRSIVTNCLDFRDWQFYPDGGGFRNDRPGVESAAIFWFRLANNAGTGQNLVVRAPEGYIFNTECTVVVESAAVFNDTNTGGIVPDGFTNDYMKWPDTTVVSNCVGRDNIATISLTCPDNCLTSPYRYVFRLSILKNPPQTPDPNKWIIEYNGEASEPFEGVKIWAFNNGTVIPTTTAASVRGGPIVNNVTVFLQPTNDVPNAGHLKIQAPEGFVMATQCIVAIRLHPDYAVNLTQYAPGIERDTVRAYVEFNPGTDYVCEGDETMSSRSRIKFIFKDKFGSFMNKSFLYELIIETTNPQVTTPYSEGWTFTSYKDFTPNLVVDSATIEGFPINDAAPSFAYMTPSSVNAMAYGPLEFNMSFPMEVIIGDMVEIVAPITFYFSLPGSDLCPQYQVLAGSLRKTIPTCGANTMSWLLQEEIIPEGTGVRFLVYVTNPPSTPDTNLFQVRQMSPGGKRKSSRMIMGYDIIPELPNVVLYQTEPEANPMRYCRSMVPLTFVPEHNCTASMSYASVIIEFDPLKAADLVQVRGDSNGVSFDFSEAVLGQGQFTISNDRIELYSRDSMSITASMVCKPDTMGNLRLDNIRLADPGSAMFHITTFAGNIPAIENRVDEKLNHKAFEVLHYIERLSSKVDPIFYGAVNAVVTFELTLATTSIKAYDVLRIERPPGYQMIQGSFQVFGNILINEDGLDIDRVWSNCEVGVDADCDYNNPKNYWVVFDRDVAPNTPLLFTMLVNLPPPELGAEKETNWYFRTYRILPQIDIDGEVLDANPVVYPWIGLDGKRRRIEALSTNDGAFEGFLLVAPVPFSIDDQTLKTPGALIKLSLTFQLPAEVSGTRDVRMEITGPTGFVFQDKCNSPPGQGSPDFVKCTGYKNTAKLISRTKRLSGANKVVHLAVTNPASTPIRNIWRVSVFEDDDIQFINYYEQPGYEILPMDVTFRGNNQIARRDVGFFDFIPKQSSLNPVFTIVIYPPAGEDYRLYCPTDKELLTFTSLQTCVSTPSDLRLTFSNGTLTADQEYTFGVQIRNPGAAVDPANNLFGILLNDHNGETFDGNLRIPGLDLKSIPIRFGDPFLGWLTPDPEVMNTVAMRIEVLHRILAGMITKIVIGAPYGIRFIENKPKIAPFELPLFQANPVQVANPADVPNSAGPLLIINMDVSMNIEEGEYTLMFEVTNPGEVNQDNTWSIMVMKDIEVEYSHYDVGYEPGRESVFLVGSAAVGVTSHAARHRPLFTMVAAAVGLLRYFATA
jgi:hypothetical protein